MSMPTPLITAEELERFPRSGRRYELVEGRLVRMSPVGANHGQVVVQIIFLLQSHLRQQNLGAAWTEVGFILAVNPDTVRAPDVAFVRRNRIPSPVPRGFFHGVPDLAVEVLSPDDRRRDVHQKVEQYLAHGATAVLVVDPDSATVSVHRRLAPPVTFEHEDDVVDLDDVIPGFSCTLRQIFE